jgi:hypothetical protein
MMTTVDRKKPSILFVFNFLKIDIDHFRDRSITLIQKQEGAMKTNLYFTALSYYWPIANLLKAALNFGIG